MIKDNYKKAVKALISFNKKYLILLKSIKEEVSPLEWDIPGGRIKAGETEKEALAREVKEETGIDISSSKILLIKSWKMNKNKVKLDGKDFLCILDKLQKIKLSEEHTDAKWLTKEEIDINQEIPTWLKETIKKSSQLDF